MNENSAPNQSADMPESGMAAYQQKLELLYKEQFRILNSERLRMEEARNSLEERHAELYERYILLVHESAENKAAGDRAKDLLRLQEEKLASLKKDVHAALAERTAAQEKCAAAEKQLLVRKAALEDASAQLEKTSAQLEETSARLAAAEQAHRVEQTRLQDELETSRRTAAEAGERLGAAEKQLLAQKAALAETSARLAATEQAHRVEQTRLQDELQAMRESLEARIPAEQYRLLRNELEHLQEEQRLLDRKNSQTVAALQGKIEQMENDAPLKIGRAFLNAGSSVRGFLCLPGALFQVWKDARTERAVQRKLLSDAGLKQLLATQGGGAVLERIAEAGLSAGKKADIAARMAKECYRQSLPAALTLMEGSLSFKENGGCRKWYAFRLFDAGNIRESCAMLAGLDASVRFSASEKNRKRFMEGCRRLLDELPAIPAAPLKPAGSNRKIVYVASSSIVYQTTGYTVRTHNLLRELARRGMDVLCVTRPGYPEDRNDLADKAGGQERRTIDKVTYLSLKGPHRRKEPLDEYIARSAEILKALFAEVDPAIVHAASNYETGLPACMAAGSLGIPFIYEVRGLWEYTAASRVAGWERSERFLLDKRLESHVLAHADAVCTLNGALREEILRRAECAAPPFLLSNAVDDDIVPATEKSAAFLERWKLSDQDFLVGYAGSVVGYEGLDVLLKAVAELAASLPRLKAVIVGTGNALEALKALAVELGIADRVIFAGAVPHAEIAQCCSIFDAAVLPRADYAVCRLVSPLKLYEYMARGLPLVVSDVKAMREMVEPERDALVFRAGDAQELAVCLRRLHDSPDLRASLRAAALNTAQLHTWSRSTEELAACYASFFAGTFPERKRGTDRPHAGTPPETVLEQTEVTTNAAEVTDVTEVEVLPCSGSSLTAEEKDMLRERLRACLSQGGVSRLMDFLRRQDAVCNRKIQAFCHLRAAEALLAAGFVEEALVRADHAVTLDGGAASLRSLARLLHDAALFDRAADAAARLRQQLGATISPKDAAFLARIQESASLLRDASAARSRCDFVPRPEVVLNILAFSLPYTSVGYATRSHGLALGIQHAGWRILPYTRPGFPGDFKKELAGKSLPSTDTVDGVTYHRLLEISRNDMSEEAYLRACADAWETIILRERPSVVHAASNYVTALPALIAAKKTGVPFVYEVRGFWEVTRSSRDESFMHTAKYRHMALFEKLVCEQADRVITITTPMKEELVRRGLPEDKIAIAFNSVDVERFVPIPRDEELARRLGIPEGCPVIGYIGSLVDYEGLDDLIMAVAALKREGLPFRLLLVGDGAVFEDLRHQVDELDLADVVIMPGRVPHEEVESWYSLVDIAPFPRKPWEVCELVSPLKPFEAMSQQKAVVVSSTRALREIVRHGENGMIFEKGNADSLRDVLRELLADADMRARLGRNARDWVTRERTWNHAGQVCVETYRQL